jgi:hypothetical protein
MAEGVPPDSDYIPPDSDYSRMLDLMARVGRWVGVTTSLIFVTVSAIALVAIAVTLIF